VNQHMNASQERTTSSNLTDLGWVAVRTGVNGELFRPVDVAGREVTVNVCGVAVTKPQEQSWVPNLSNGSRVNVGTIWLAPLPARSQCVGGKACRQLMLAGWGGGVVVVRAQESCVHGEGPQCVRSINVERGVRW